MLTSVKGEQILIELKNGESVYGKLTNIDNWMNLTLSNVVHNYNDGAKFTKLDEIYIRGNHIKFLRLPNLVRISRTRNKRQRINQTVTNRS